MNNELVAQLNKKIQSLEVWVNDLQKGTYINCVYCGHRYGPNEDTPASMADVLKEHIEQCPEHPASELKKQLEWMKAAHLLLAQDDAFIGQPEGSVFWINPELTTEGTPVLALNMNDTFHYACADSEPFRYEDAPMLLEIATKEGWPGLLNWASQQRAERGEPSEPLKTVKEDANDQRHLRAELERFKRGDITEEEAHNMCHNLEKTVSAEEFDQACHRYQKKLFGVCPSEARIQELEEQLEGVDACAEDEEVAHRETLDLLKRREGERDEAHALLKRVQRVLTNEVEAKRCLYDQLDALDTETPLQAEIKDAMLALSTTPELEQLLKEI